ncbi:hypothetical protein ACFVTP_13130 [Streptomyces celluloflavus]|uniref:hypothetical protein n=1 Tax=Streptomyces celluloflavus TaxID=58344 RepID=UPI0036DA5639
MHRDALGRAGMLAINKQHGSLRPLAYKLLRFGTCRPDLWCDQGRIAEPLLAAEQAAPQEVRRHTVHTMTAGPMRRDRNLPGVRSFAHRVGALT